MRLELGSWTPLLLRSATVGRERPTATPPAALIKLRESASKLKARRQGGPRTATSGTSWPRRPRVRRRDGGESERRRHTGSQIPQPPCYRRPGSGRATVTFSGSTNPVWASADPLPVPSCGVAFRPERCRRITCALQQRLVMKMKAKIFRYRESFSKFYRDFGVNKNENGYRKYRNRYVKLYS